MRAHAVKIAGVDFAERLELMLLQVEALENFIGISPVLVLEFEIVEQLKQQLVDLIETHLVFPSSSFSERTMDKS